ncbi:hypothetical protein C723_3295 [Christiangramia flava JLT2011]|uniref:Uncharacterized protein n=1 Tax=Christiangramia flava JLT2011 TaxID=1229726 RepID=A0A1L7I8B9_9FLAO|nr:hypothetical protein GRFL_3134 [Christiangramia flava JLT2011]OSS37826.1 hypothetical protein C723_3295 [Christiangramia flava JLT2011]
MIPRDEYRNTQAFVFGVVALAYRVITSDNRDSLRCACA